MPKKIKRTKGTSIRLDDVQEELDYVKNIFGIDNTSKIVKLCVIFTKNVVQNFFGDKLHKVFSTSVRYSFRKESKKRLDLE